MPVAMKLARPKAWAWQFDHRIDWQVPVTDEGTAGSPGSAAQAEPLVLDGDR
jgi:hypothetical protein